MRIARRLGSRLVEMVTGVVALAVTAWVPVSKPPPVGGEKLSESFYIGPLTLCPGQRVMGLPS
jgi:hypothetical protein